MKLWGVVFVVVGVLAAGACKDKTPSTKAPEPAAQTKCKEDSDCVLSCAKRDSCCSAPCCETVILASEYQAIETYNQSHCPKDPQCPTVGGCQMDYIVTPRCQAGVCVADKTLNIPAFATNCTNNGDCILVNVDPCDPCGCMRAPMNKSEEERAKAYVASVKCPPRPRAECADCVDLVPECVSGLCTSKKK